MKNMWKDLIPTFLLGGGLMAILNAVLNRRKNKADAKKAELSFEEQLAAYMKKELNALIDKVQSYEGKVEKMEQKIDDLLAENKSLHKENISLLKIISEKEANTIRIVSEMQGMELKVGEIKAMLCKKCHEKINKYFNP